MLTVMHKAVRMSITWWLQSQGSISSRWRSVSTKNTPNFPAHSRFRCLFSSPGSQAVSSSFPRQRNGLVGRLVIPFQHEATRLPIRWMTSLASTQTNGRAPFLKASHPPSSTWTKTPRRRSYVDRGRGGLSVEIPSTYTTDRCT